MELSVIYSSNKAQIRTNYYKLRPKTELATDAIL